MTDVLTDPGQWFAYAGMAIGAFVAAFIARMGWKSASAPKPADIMISGQAAITDMKPVRDMLEQANLVCLKLMEVAVAVQGMAAEQTKVAQSLARLATLAESYLDNAADQRKIDQEVERRVEARRVAIEADMAREHTTPPTRQR